MTILLSLNLESRLSGLAFSLIGMWWLEMGQAKEHDASNYGMEQLPARLVQFASELCNRVPGDRIVTVKRVISDLTYSWSRRAAWVNEVLHTEQYFDCLSTAKCGYCPDPEYADTAERPGLLTLSISICRSALRDLFPFGVDVTIPIVEQGSLDWVSTRYHCAGRSGFRSSVSDTRTSN